MSVKIHWSSQQIADSQTAVPPERWRVWLANDWHFYLSPMLNNVFYRVTFIQGCSEHFPSLISILFQGSMKQLGGGGCMSFSLFLFLVPVCSHITVKAAEFYVAWMTWNKPPVCVTWWPDEGVLLLLHWVAEAISRGKQRLRNLVEIMPLLKRIACSIQRHFGAALCWNFCWIFWILTRESCMWRWRIMGGGGRENMIGIVVTLEMVGCIS